MLSFFYIPKIPNFLLLIVYLYWYKQGFAIGNGLTDPSYQYKAYPDYALDMGIIDKSVHDRISKVIPVCEMGIKLCGNVSFLGC